MRDRGRRGRRTARKLALWAFVVAAGALFLVSVVAAIGLHQPIIDGYFALSLALLPTSWHDEWQALPGVVHLAMAGVGLAAVAGLAGEVLD